MLMIAASTGNKEMADFLLDAGLEVDEVDDDGYTALMLAVAADDLSMIELLLGRGADPALTNRDGDSARSIAELRENEAATKLLASSPGKGKKKGKKRR
jgi:ankyrin repeat protein